MQWTTQNTYRGQIRRWVGAAGSLSAHLAGAGQVFSVQVLNQGPKKLSRDEAQALGLLGQAHGYVREVVLRVDGVAVVFARSVTPHAASLGSWRAIRGLGTRPLADILFKRSGSGIARTPLAFARLKLASPLQAHVARAWQAATGQPMATQALPARRSVFTRRSAPLLVMEVFADQQVPWCWPRSKFSN